MTSPKIARSTPKLQDLSHRELVALCIHSPPDHPAWMEFYHRFSPWIKRYLKKAWNTRHHCSDAGNSYASEAVADLVQDTYLLLLKDDRQALCRFRGTTDSSFLAYLSVICTNAVRERLRIQRADKRKAAMVSLEHLLETAQTSGYGRKVIFKCFCVNPEPEIVSHLRSREVLKLLDTRVKGEHRRRDQMIFKLSVVDGFTSAELAVTARRFGLKASAIESIVRRTRDKLVQAVRTTQTRYATNYKKEERNG